MGFNIFFYCTLLLEKTHHELIAAHAGNIRIVPEPLSEEEEVFADSEGLTIEKTDSPFLVV